MPQYRFDLPNMTCSGCERGVKAAIAEIDPAALVTTDLDTRSATIDSALPQEQLLAALDEAGFTA